MRKIAISIFLFLLVNASAFATVVNWGGNTFTGLSSDFKPTNVSDGSRFFTIDSKNVYIKSNGTWTIINTPVSALVGTASIDQIPDLSSLYTTPSAVSSQITSSINALNLGTASTYAASAFDIFGAAATVQSNLNALLSRTTNTNTGDETQASIISKLTYTPQSNLNGAYVASFNTRTGNVTPQSSDYSSYYLSSGYTGSTGITTVGTISSGTWNGSAIADSYISSAATWNSKQAGSSNLTSLSGLSYVSPAFVKMTGANTFTLDTNAYLTSNQTITLTGDISGSGTTTISTTVNSIKNVSVPTLAAGFLKYTGSAWSFDSSTYLTSASTLSAGNLSGTIPSAVLGNSTVYIGTTGIALNRASASQALTGITSIDGSAAKWTTARNLAGNSVDGSANVAFSNKFIVQGTADTGLSSAQFLGALGTGILKNTTTTGVLSIATGQADFTGLTSTDSPTFTTVKLTSLTDGYIPYHVSGASGLANSPIYTDGTKVGIGITTPKTALQIDGGFTLNVDTGYGSNLYYSAGFKYVNNGYGSFVGPVSGDFYFYLAPNNTNGADAAASPTVVMKILNAGNVLIGSTTNHSGEKLQVTGTAYVSSTLTAGGFTGPLTGNASTATTLQTARAINGTNFDGSAAITVPVNNANSTTNATMYPLFTATQGGNYAAVTNSGFTFNPSTGSMLVSNLTASTSQVSTSLTLNGTSGASILLVNSGTGNAYVANGTVATTMTSLGPTGAHTTIQGWMVVKYGGTTGYIPIY